MDGHGSHEAFPRLIGAMAKLHAFGFRGKRVQLHQAEHIPALFRAQLRLHPIEPQN